MRFVLVSSVLILALSAACGGSSGGTTVGKATAPANATGGTVATNSAVGVPTAAGVAATNTVPAAEQRALAACAKDPRCAAAQGDEAAAGKKACTLVTQAEAAAVLGKPVGPGDVRGTICTYTDTDPATQFTVTIDLEPSTGGAAAKRQFDAEHKGSSGAFATVEDVSGLGDGAFIVTPKEGETGQGALGVIHVLSGQSDFYIQIVNETAAANTTASLRPLLIELARTALTRL